LEDLDRAENNSIVLLHAGSHNPTSLDPNQEQWEEICNVIKRKHHFPFFDMAYQGINSGDTDQDAWPIRHFAENGVKVALSQSFSKNMGLSGQRIGCLSVMTDDSQQAENVLSQLKFLARAQYSNPPKHGAHIVDIILSDSDLTQEWHREIKVMAGRIASIRQELYKGIMEAGSKASWEHIIRQSGMFAYTGLTEEQVATLKKAYHIYLTDDGRISVSGLNTKNVDYVAQAFYTMTQHNDEVKMNKQNRF